MMVLHGPPVAVDYEGHEKERSAPRSRVAAKGKGQGACIANIVISPQTRRQVGYLQEGARMVRDPSLYTGSKGHKNDFSQVSGGRSMGTDDGTSPRPRSLRPVVTIVLAMLCSFVILEGTRQAQFHVATGLARIEGAASKILGNIEQLQGKLISPSPVHAGANAVGLGASTTRSQASSSAQTSLSQVRPSIYMSDRQHTHTHLHILPGADRGFLGDNIAGWQARP